MPSRMHQMLIGLIARKMQERGYTPVAFDGLKYVFCGREVLVPPRIGKHRPDVIGVDLEAKVVCIGEAKTESDLSTDRTKEQLKQYANIVGVTSGERFELIIGIPKGAESALRRLLCRLGIERLPNVSYLVLPEDLVENDPQDFV